MADIERITCVQDDLEAYRPFFDRNWGITFMQTVRGSKIQDIGFDLTRNWEAASKTRALPWLMIKCLDVMQHQNLEEVQPFTVQKIHMYTNRLIKFLEDEGEKMGPMRRRRLQSALSRFDEHATESLRTAKDECHDKLEDHWKDLIDKRDFHLSIWNSERMCYGSIYYSYEWFLKECVRVSRKVTSYRVDRNFNNDFKDAFGQKLTEACWTDQQVNIARLARNALVHNGGRITADLRKQKHPFHLEGEELQIGASMTTTLYQLLAQKSKTLADYAVRLPAFKKSP